MLPRVVQRELLDDLAVDDPLAVQSRRDLKRVHRTMRTRTILLQALRGMPRLRRTTAPLRILEIGAGDGSLMLRVAQALAPAWPPVHLTLLDAKALIAPDTVAGYAAVGWTAVSYVGDVFDWADGSVDTGTHSQGNVFGPWDLIVANLFLHHFEGPTLVALLRTVADRCDEFLACEPHRAWPALVGSHLVGALGANGVTREDAVASVHAGFRGGEITATWPEVGDKWDVQEYAAGMFSHCFRAHRILVD